MRYWNSEKGKNLYKRRLELMRKNPKRQPHFCGNCGKQISRRSVLCLNCSLENARQKLAERSPNWKGGKVTNTQGYVLIRANTEQGNRGYIREHQLVWEKSHGKTLPKGWVIHHLNSIRDDNRPANLVAMPRKKHNQLQQAMVTRIQELEALVRQQGLLL